MPEINKNIKFLDGGVGLEIRQVHDIIRCIDLVVEALEENSKSKPKAILFVSDIRKIKTVLENSLADACTCDDCKKNKDKFDPKLN